MMRDEDEYNTSTSSIEMKNERTPLLASSNNNNNNNNNKSSEDPLLVESTATTNNQVNHPTSNIRTSGSSRPQGGGPLHADCSSATSSILADKKNRSQGGLLLADGDIHNEDGQDTHNNNDSNHTPSSHNHDHDPLTSYNQQHTTREGNHDADPEDNDAEEEEEHVAFLNSDDDAEEYENDLEDDLEAFGHYVTFALEDDDDDDEEEDNGGSHTQQSYQECNAQAYLKDTDHNNMSSIASPSRRHRSNSFDSQHTGYTQNTVFSEAIVTVISHAKEALVEGITEVSHVVSEVLHEEIRPVQPRPEGHHAQKLSALALAVLVFYKVSGGPFGCEPAVRSAGPFWALVGFCTFPFIWCLQEALVTAELGSAFPEPSGCK
jgi:hypothetical protein